MPLASPLRRSLAIAFFGLSLAACGASIKVIKFPVQENGHAVTVEKYFFDGYFYGATDNPLTRAFKVAQRNDFQGAIAMLRVHLQEHPDHAWGHYDLGILYEATGDWAAAEASMREAMRLSEGPGPDPARNTDRENAHKISTKELGFIQRRRGLVAAEG
ncbi:MAG: tetratricopeptide repeat protein [Polyangiaceae bacterium]|nr:tetratricopeptide repeat protein [Polyangiaceae bacterium]